VKIKIYPSEVKRSRTRGKDTGLVGSHRFIKLEEFM
jgi:hypothetical protein